ncbi:hypothetical protein [Roseicyclus sp.]|uniref:hypothetical protein n=1 Tax=Roseicyclus sp. TaxID=1914329 RepID=UPI003F6D061A
MQHHLRRAIVAASFALGVMASPLVAHSPQIPPPQAQQTAPAAPQMRSDRAIRFDWQANRPAATARATTTARSRGAPGRGSYICTAAGFGQMSRCVAR